MNAFGRALLWGVSILLAASVSTRESHAQPWALHPPCESRSPTYLQAPGYEEARQLDHSGSRTWNFHRILDEQRKGRLSGDCLNSIWDQAYGDAHEYWTDIGSQYGCLDAEGKVPATRPKACPEKKWEAVESNLHFLDYASRLHERTGVRATPSDAAVPCQTRTPPDPIDNLGTDLAQVVGPRPTPPRRVAEASIGVDAEELFASDVTTVPASSGISDLELTQTNPCAEIPLEKRSQSAVPEGWRYYRDQVWGCVKGAAQGIYDTLESTISGLWDLLVLGKNVLVGTGKAVLDLAEAMYQGSVTDLVTEWATNSEAAFNKLVRALMGIPEAIYGWLQRESDYFMCLNETAQREYICKASTRVIGEIGLTAIGLEAAKVGRLPAVASAGEWADEGIKASRLSGAAIRAAEAYRNLRILDSVPNGLRWIRDTSIGREVAVEGEKVFVRINGKVAEVVNSRLVTALRRGVTVAQEAASATYRYLRTVPATARSAMERSLQWVRDTKNGLYVAFENGKAYVKQGGQIFEVAKADAVEKIKTGVAKATAAYERKVAQYQDELAEWRARKVSAEAPKKPPEAAPAPKVETPPPPRSPYAQDFTTPSGSRVVFEGAAPAETYALAQRKGLLPTEVVDINGGKVTLGNLFNMGEGRVGALMEVEIDGVRYTRLVYRSNSQGVFRVLPARNSGVPFVPGYDKGIGEASLDLPATLQKKLSDKMRSESPVHINEAEQTILIDGSVRTNRNYVEYSEYHDSPGFIGNSVQSNHLIPIDIPRPLITYKGRPMANPGDVKIPTPELQPDFAATPQSFKTSTAVAGEVEALIYPSKDGSLTYTVYKGSDGKIWIASIQDNAAGLTTHGTSRRVLESGELLTPRWEYHSQIPTEYLGATNTAMSDYADAWSYLKEMPVIQDWYRAQGIPIP